MIRVTLTEAYGDNVRTFGPFCHAGLRWHTLYGYGDTAEPLACWDEEADGWILYEDWVLGKPERVAYSDINIYEEEKA